ncbi:MAG: M48 family metalloprotease [Chthonomonas sp.]|nr:M48 family metalloprotease [Chthonomonas sp.]
MRRIRNFAVATTLVGAATMAQAQSLKPDFKTQLKLGKEAAAELRTKEKVLPGTDTRVKLLRSLGEKLIRTIPDAEWKSRPYEFSFDVIESKEVNAFCLPGGPVFFYTGLLDKMSTVDQLVGVLGHEVGHARMEHWARQVEDSNKKGLLFGIASEIFNIGKTGQDLASLALGVDQLKYGRKNENQADVEGFNSVVAMGYNPQGMVDVFRMFEAMKKGNNSPEWLSSHPDDKKRIQRLEDMTKKSKRTFPAQQRLPWLK